MTDSTEPAGYGHAETLAAVAAETIRTMTPADYLAALGSTADQVAATLAALGITGTQVVSDACPIARYLTNHAELGWAVVSTETICIDELDPFTTPLPVAEFVRAFDRGAYPDLIAHGGHWDSTL